jgi:hypothetical protein
MTAQIIEFKKIEQEGIDFYVSNDGQVTGMSSRGISAFTGLGASTVIELIQAIDSGDRQNDKINENARFQRLPDSLKALHGKLFIGRSAKIENNAKLLNSDACEEIIFHFAFENENIKPHVQSQVIKAYRKFAKHGLHEYIKTISGFIVEDHQDQLMFLMRRLIDDVENFRAEAKEYRVIRETALGYPGGDYLLTEWSKEITQNLLDAEKFSLESWVSSKGITLDRSTKYKFAFLVAATYKALKKENPTKGHCEVNDKIKYNVSMYTMFDVPILQMCLNKTLNL